MDDNEISLDDLARLSKMLKWKKSKRYYAKRLGVSIKQIDKMMKKVSVLKDVKQKEWTKKEDLLKGTLESSRVVSKEPNSHKELAIVHNVDLSKFVITNYWSKLQANGDFLSSIFCKRKKSEDYSAEDFEEFLTTYKSTYSPPSVIKWDGLKSNKDIEVSVSDFHLAKRYVTQKNRAIEKRAEKFFEIVEKLVERCAFIYNLDTIVFPISNDFFHTDTYFNTSTKGTPQDVIAEYDKEYEVGFDLLVKCIIFLKSRCKKLKVVLVQGNHDRTKSYYLAHGLNAYFKDADDIEFIRDSAPTKGIKIGNTFIGYHHGNCKIDELPLVFATNPKYCKDFGESKFREVHTGDKHHYMAKEVKGVRIQQMPSMSGDDRWHRDQNYVHNIRAALVLVYDREKGKIGEFEERI